MAAPDEARRLLAKAAEDEYVLDRLLRRVPTDSHPLLFRSSRLGEMEKL